MGIGVKILIYSYLIMLVYITFVNLREINKKMINDNDAKMLKLNKIGFLFFKAENNDSNVFYSKIVIMETILYIYIICMIIAFIFSLSIEDKISLIIYGVLWSIITSFGIYTGQLSIKK